LESAVRPVDEPSGDEAGLWFYPRIGRFDDSIPFGSEMPESAIAAELPR
jgi:hypothetical protein